MDSSTLILECNEFLDSLADLNLKVYCTVYDNLCILNDDNPLNKFDNVEFDNLKDENDTDSENTITTKNNNKDSKDSNHNNNNNNNNKNNIHYIPNKFENFDKYNIYSDKKQLLNDLEKNLVILEDYREKMELKGFDTPYIGVGRLNGGEEDDIYDILNYSSYLRRVVDEKKGSLERVKYAIVSHKIAIGNLQDSGNLDLICNLPYDGSYKEFLLQLPHYVVKTYKKFLTILNSEGKSTLSSTTLSIVIKENGRRRFKRIKVEEEDYEKYIRDTYGDAIITSIKKNYTKSKLLNDQYVKKILALSYLHTYQSLIGDKILKNISKMLNMSELSLITQYKQICQNYERADCDGGIIDVRQINELKFKKLQLISKLEDCGLYKDGKPLKCLEKSLEVENAIFEDACLNVPLSHLSNDLLKYYLNNTADERTRSNLFPSILVTPSKSQLAWLRLKTDHKKVLNYKLILEKEFPKYDLPIKLTGGILLYLAYDWDIVENYGYSKSEIESALKIICNIEDITKKLDCEPFSIEKLKEYNNIKKKKTKKFLNALGKI
ncbi:DUF530 family protein [Methanococcus voltae]|uniref:Zn-finger domain-containing protein n=1 Tax=Methanococcus voltae PS TaxID=523842 RepID=A0ABT2EY33_METVO|nr:DUF530 family protein [Methanococcus voltae]MBP2171963.1 Zn-finger domain-containing protein [Methanococcus voltae]MCS3921805.1 Zn-finger domain-containing protein [Methanococcus voltae PS]